MDGIYARQFPGLDRAVQIGVASGRVVSVSFPPDPPADADPDHPLLDRVAAYLDGERETFDDVTVALTVPTDQREVLEGVRKIPYGETADVGQVARLAALDPEDAEAVELVRTALEGNPVPLFVPDHRVTERGATPAAVADRLRDIEATPR
jgi:methylated-DNA-[protein]-cysteine S-methyltransferase